VIDDLIAEIEIRIKSFRSSSTLFDLKRVYSLFSLKRYSWNCSGNHSYEIKIQSLCIHVTLLFLDDKSRYLFSSIQSKCQSRAVCRSSMLTEVLVALYVTELLIRGCMVSDILSDSLLELSFHYCRQVFIRVFSIRDIAGLNYQN